MVSGIAPCTEALQYQLLGPLQCPQSDPEPAAGIAACVYNVSGITLLHLAFLHLRFCFHSELSYDFLGLASLVDGVCGGGAG